MKRKRTRQADAYVQTLRAKRGDDPATWFDVAEAYDAGLYSAVQARPSAKRALRQRDEEEHLNGEAL